MFYHLFDYSRQAMRPARAAADSYRLFFKNPFNPFTHTTAGRSAAAACEVFERMTRRYDKPHFDVPTTEIDGATVGVVEEVVWQRPFCNLVHFKRDIDPATAARQPRVLLVAPMSGHFATLLRGTVETFLPDHEVYITDWVDARDMPLSAGRFDLDDYIDYIADMFRHFGGDVHVFAVCQPSVPVLAAVARMEAINDPAVPHSLTLAGGPVDTRISPTAVNKLAEEKGTDWFRRNVINSVPWPNRGGGRQVYPGFLQLTGFMTMNLDRHVKAHKDLFIHLVDGDGDNADKHREFYDEYLAVMDLTAEFYLQTIETVFVDHHLPRGIMTHRGQPVDLTAIRRVALMTIEGEKDDITGIGQCRAALDLCASIPRDRKQHFECPKVGHYGVFNGRRFRTEIAPRMQHFMRRFDPRTAAATPVQYGADVANVASLEARRKDAKSRDMEHSAFAFADAAAHASSADSEPQTPARAPSHAGGSPHGAAPLLEIGINASTAALQFWSITGRAMFDNMARLHSVVPPVKSEVAS